MVRGGRVTVGCDGGRFTWDVLPEGGWGTGETLSFFYESSRPPGGLGDIALTAGEVTGTASVPRPTAREGKVSAEERCL